MSEVIETKQEQIPEIIEKLKKEKENFKLAAEKHAKEKEEALAIIRQKDENELKIKEDFKALADLKSKELEEYKAKYNNFQAEIEKQSKLGSLRKELEKLGAKNDKIDILFNLSKIDQIKLEKGDNDKILGVYGAEEEARRIQSIIPEVFGKATAGSNHDAPPANNNPLSVESFNSLPLKERVKKEAEFYKQMGIEVKR
jgi:hypothetical protein